MLGDEAIAQAAIDAGLSGVFAYPGTPSTEITEFISTYDDVYSEWAPNEKVAAEVALGAAIAGARAFCGMKHVGLNVAADPLFTISYTGVNAGMLIAVADDAGMHSSQNEQDSRHYAIAAKMPMLEPSDSAEAIEFAKLGYEISEKFDTAVLIKMCTRVAHSQSIVEENERILPEDKPYEKDGAKYIMMPGNAKKRHPIVEERTKALTEFAETSEINRIEKGTDSSIGIITSSTSYQYVKEVCGDKYSVLKLGMINPMPVEKIKNFAKSVDRVIVVEELDGFIETHCKNIGVEVSGKEIFGNIGEFSQNLVAEKLGEAAPKGVALNENIPMRPPVMCAGCPHRGLFYTLKKNKITVSEKDEGTMFLQEIQPANEIPMQDSMDKMTVQVAFVIAAYFVAYLLMVLLGLMLPGMKSVIFGFNFILGVLSATLFKTVINFMRKKKIINHGYINDFLMTRISNFFFDIMVVAGVAAIRLGILEKYWGIMLILGVVGLVSTYVYNLFVAKTLFKDYPQEQFLMMYGMLTGTASTGTILLREIDGEFKTPVADNLVYQNFPAIVFGFPMMLLANLAPENPPLTMALLIPFFIVMNIILFRSKIFKKKNKKIKIMGNLNVPHFSFIILNIIFIFFRKNIFYFNIFFCYFIVFPTYTNYQVKYQYYALIVDIMKS